MLKLLTPSTRWLATLASLLCTLALATPAQADPAGRVGRIAWLSSNGTVQLDNKSTGESFSAPLNQPLTSGDILTTGTNTRTEIQIGSITLRLDSGSRLEFDRIDDEQVAVYLAEGRTIARLSSPDTLRDFTFETRNGRFTARETGAYRFDAYSGASSAMAYAGSLRMESQGHSLDIRSGERAQVQDGTPARLSAAFNDSFSEWSYGRDQRPAAKKYARYVSPEMTGAEDLDAHGNWAETPEYGAVWYPREVASDWAPYRTGHWVWVAPWGWNWVGNEPWGFAPFHYGRWVHYHGRWGWVPGVRIARPVYAPAMVAWVGSPSFGISISIGSAPTVGWFPLGPREVYVPSYRCGTNYVRNVNVTHVTNVTNITNIVNNPQTVVQKTHYMHRHTPHAMTVVPADVVSHRKPVDTTNIAYREHRGLRDQPIQAGAPVAAPRADTRIELANHQRRDERGRVAGDGERPRANTAVQPEQPNTMGRNERFNRDHRNRGDTERQADTRTPVMASQTPTPANGSVTTTRQTESREPADRESKRLDRKQAQSTPATAAVPARETDRPAVASLPQTTDVTPRRAERPPVEAPQTPATTARAEPAELRMHERSVRRDDKIVVRPHRDNRNDTTPQPVATSTQRVERPIVEPARPTPVDVRTPERMPERLQERPREARTEPAPQPTMVAVQRVERPMPEVARPAPQPRPEPVAMPPQREMRSEPVQQRQIVSAPVREMRAEAPPVREMRHEASRNVESRQEPRQEARNQRADDHRHKRDDGDRK